ncbi:hypothetical protein FH5_02302 [Priestia endophytica]|nr:hypothetical protein FH5_02302 [Priestia endophytica]
METVLCLAIENYTCSPPLSPFYISILFLSEENQNKKGATISRNFSSFYFSCSKQTLVLTTFVFQQENEA